MSIENEYMVSAGGTGALGRASLTQQFPARPGYGTQGKKIAVFANYFKVMVPLELAVTRYNVEVSPEAQGRKLYRIFELLIELPEFRGVISDMKSMIISRSPLTGISNGHTVQIQYRGDGQDEPLENAPTYNIRIVTPLTVNISDLNDYLAAVQPGPVFVQKAEFIQILNVIFGHHAQSHSEIVSTGQNRHFSISRAESNRHNIRALGGGLESLRGFYQSVRAATGGLLVNVNVSHNVFLQPERLDRLYGALGSNNKVTLNKKLKSVRVDVLHLPGKNKNGREIRRTKIIFGLAHQQDGSSEDHPPQIASFGAGPKHVKFWLAAQTAPAAKPASGKAKKSSGSGGSKTGAGLPSNQYISVFDYFRLKYPQIPLSEHHSVVNVGNREHPSYLPAEACLVQPGQTIKRRLSPDQTQQMIQFACRKPFENGDSIIGDGRIVLGHSNTEARFGLAIGSSLITVAARQLNAPVIKYKNNQGKETPITPRGGSWNMANIRFHTGSNIGPWTFITFRSNRGRDYGVQDVKQTVLNFQRFLLNSGINASQLLTTPPPPEILLQDGQEGANDAAIRNIFRAMHGSTGTRPNFVLCILPFNDVAIYNSIKTIADTRAGINTVCCVGSKFMKEQRQDQYFGNVSLKFNLKAGGINQTLEAPKLGIISEGKTMVVGIDVTHPSPGSKEKAPSAAGIVASVDKFLGQWPCDFRIQEGRKEMVSSLEGMFLSRLITWERKNKTLPENVLIYRDGVSEGQYQQLLDIELPQIRNACKQKYPPQVTKSGLPRITIVVCGKRHHTRFFPTTEGEADRSSNCNPGTIVDRGVTEVRNWDFFVQSHACLQGTARPGHYYVVLDEIFRGRSPKPPHQNAADALEELTHNMCHLFGRATKAVSLCPPAYYADLLCTRLRCYLSDYFDPNDSSATQSTTSGVSSQPTFDVRIPDNLRDTMFYI
ncbi:QDE2 protein [Tricladium varicosporioides]|nr:QDE2 protein [Hymenoscyphus varicosporioides]